MTRLLALPVALPLAGAAVTALAGQYRRLQRGITAVIGLALLGFAIALVVATRDGQVLVSQVGDWPPPFAIPLAADLFSGLMLTVSALMIVVCVTFAMVTGEPERAVFHPLALILAAGVAGAFLTADLFNLFVFFEVMLIASYVLLTVGGTRAQVSAGAVYITTNLLASTVLIAAVGLTS